MKSSAPADAVLESLRRVRIRVGLIAGAIALLSTAASETALAQLPPLGLKRKPKKRANHPLFF